MRIARAEVIPYALPFREPYVTSRGRIDRRELVLFRLTREDGAVGLGETTSLSLRGGTPLAAIVAELEEIAERATRLVGTATGDPGKPTVTPIEALGLDRCSREAFCAWSTAVTDLGAQDPPGIRRSEAGAGESPEPHSLDPLPCNATLSAGPPERVAQAAVSFRERGFTSFKLKLGTGDDVAQVAAVRKALGAEARIRLDPNGAWGLSEAVERLNRLEPLEIELCEQPVATLEEMSELRASTTIPIAADETVVSPDDARHARALGACDLVTLKLAKSGGLANALQIAQLIPAYMSSALDGPVGIAAGGHGANQLIRHRLDASVAHGLATQLLFSETIAAQGPEVRDGFLHLPPGPGLGVEIDEDALQRHRL